MSLDLNYSNDDLSLQDKLEILCATSPIGQLFVKLFSNLNIDKYNRINRLRETPDTILVKTTDGKWTEENVDKILDPLFFKLTLSFQQIIVELSDYLNNKFLSMILIYFQKINKNPMQKILLREKACDAQDILIENLTIDIIQQDLKKSSVQK
jgi:hypothetical protein